jgi:hypothetical protein
VNTEGIAFFKGGAEVVKKGLGGTYVPQVGNISKPMNTAGKKSCGKQWKCRILGATRLHSTMQRAAALYYDLVHILSPRRRAQGARLKG